MTYVRKFVQNAILNDAYENVGGYRLLYWKMDHIYRRMAQTVHAVLMDGYEK